MLRSTVSVASFAIGLVSLACAAPLRSHDGQSVELSVADGLLENSTNGRVMVLLAPAGVDPLEDTDVVTSPNHSNGKNVFHVDGSDRVTLSGGSGVQPRTSVSGFPNVSVDDVSPGDYTGQAFLNRYETAPRSDGSVVSVRFPCGDGAPPIDGPGSLTTAATNVTVSGRPQTIKLTFDNVTASEDPDDTEIGSCSQGNYENTEYTKYVKIRSSVLSDFWNRDIFVGANVLLPHGYNVNDSSTRYPVLYHQNHCAADSGAYGYLTDEDFTNAWNTSIISWLEPHSRS